MSTVQKLNRLRGRSTCHEVIAEHPTDARRFLVCYLCRTTQRGLLQALRHRTQRLITSLGLPPNVRVILMTDAAGLPIAHLADWTIRLTGRTEREAIVAEDELPSI